MKYIALVCIAILTLSLVSLPEPEKAEAECVSGQCFGGYALPFAMECTCNYYYHMNPYFPFYQYGSQIPIAALFSVPAVVSYPNHMTSPAQYQLGLNVLGSETCEMYTPYGCVPFPVYGTILEETSVSLPTSIH